MLKRPKSGMILVVMRRIARAGKAIPMTVLLLTEIFVVNSVASIGEKLESGYLRDYWHVHFVEKIKEMSYANNTN